MIRTLYRFCNRNWWQIHTIRLLLLILGWVLALAGCGSERTEQQNTVEQETWEAGPTVFETPVGTVVMHKTGLVRKLSRYRTTTEQQQYTFPEARDVGGAILGGLTGPLAGGGIVGLLAAGAGWLIQKKNNAEKAELRGQRDELIDGAERMKGKLSNIEDPENPKLTAWDHAKVALEAEQSKGTKAAVKARTS